MSTEKKTEHPDEAGYETTDVDVVSIVFAGLIVALGVVLVVLICTGMFQLFSRIKPLPAEMASPMTEAPKPPPLPRLQIHPEKDLRVLREQEDAVLNGYGWVNRQAGIVYIPIHRAMELLLQRGLPVQGQPGAPAAGTTNLELSQKRPQEYTAPKGEEAK